MGQERTSWCDEKEEIKWLVHRRKWVQSVEPEDRVGDWEDKGCRSLEKGNTNGEEEKTYGKKGKESLCDCRDHHEVQQMVLQPLEALQGGRGWGLPLLLCSGGRG